jgi:hypothetical protein
MWSSARWRESEDEATKYSLFDDIGSTVSAYLRWAVYGHSRVGFSADFV